MKTLHFFFLSVLVFFYCSCSDYFWCTVSGYGTTPIEQTYYIEPMDSSLIDDLQYREFEQILKKRLEEIGYLETTRESAALCVRFGYYVGERELKGVSSYSMSNSSGFSFGTITSNSKAMGKANVVSNVTGNTRTTNVATNAKSKTKTDINQFSFSGNRTQGYTEPIYKQTITCIVEAFDSSKSEPVWKVEAKDELSDDSSLRKVMPWIISSAQQLIGKSGEEKVVIKKKDGEKLKGLNWPY